MSELCWIVWHPTMLSGEQKIRRGFHWVAVILAALLLAFGLVLITFDVRDLWHPDAEDIPPTSLNTRTLKVSALTTTTDIITQRSAAT